MMHVKRRRRRRSELNRWWKTRKNKVIYNNKRRNESEIRTLDILLLKTGGGGEDWRPKGKQGHKKIKIKIKESASASHLPPSHPVLPFWSTPSPSPPLLPSNYRILIYLFRSSMNPNYFARLYELWIMFLRRGSGFTARVRNTWWDCQWCGVCNTS